MYDYVIVGAGSAGCVLAARLGEDPDVRVAVIEAGPPDDGRRDPRCRSRRRSLAEQPLGLGLSSEPEPGLDDRRNYLPRGRVLGGSSSLNAMIYIRGNRADYDEWAAMGLDGWGYEDVLPYFKRAEDNERGASRYHGVGGPLSVSDGRSMHPLVEACIEAAGRGRHRPQRRPQRRHAGRRRPLPGHAARRQALQRRGRLPAPGRGARQRRRAHRCARPDPVRGRARGRRRGACATAGSSRSAPSAR